MNKKIILSVLGVSLLLTSCGTKPLGTYQEELKAQQAIYVKNIDNYFSVYSKFSEWKFSDKWDFTLDVKVPTVWEAVLKYAYDYDLISENKKFSFQGDNDINLSVKTKENSDIWEASNVKANWNLKFRTGFEWTTAYAVIKNFDFNVESANQNVTTQVEEAKKQYELFVKPYLARWYSVDFSKLAGFETFMEEFSKQMENSLTNSEAIEFLKEISTTFLAGDIFTDEAEKTTYNWVEAYKFSIDKVKMIKHFSTSMKGLITKYPQVFGELSTYVSQLDETANNAEEIAKNMTITSEIYLTRAKDGSANLIIEKFSVDDKTNISLKIIDNTVTFNVIDSYNDLNIVFKSGKSGNITFTGKLSENSYEWNFWSWSWAELTKSLKEVFNFSWDITSKVSDTTANTKLNIDLNVPWVADAFDFIMKNGLTLKISLQDEMKKDDSIVISKETITEKATEVQQLDEFISKYLESSLFWALDNYDYSELEDLENYTWDLDDYSFTWTIE